jgi:hypothetical protein
MPHILCALKDPGRQPVATGVTTRVLSLSSSTATIENILLVVHMLLSITDCTTSEKMGKQEMTWR